MLGPDRAAGHQAEMFDNGFAWNCLDVCDYHFFLPQGFLKINGFTAAFGCDLLLFFDRSQSILD